MEVSIKFAFVTRFCILVLGLLRFLHARTEPASRLTVKFENERVRVLELLLKPGQSERQHSHPQYVLYPLTDYKVRNTSADGTVRVFERKAGEVFWGDPITHGGENVGTTDVHAIIVELKPTSHP